MQVEQAYNPRSASVDALHEQRVRDTIQGRYRGNRCRRLRRTHHGGKHRPICRVARSHLRIAGRSVHTATGIRYKAPRRSRLATGGLNGVAKDSNGILLNTLLTFKTDWWPFASWRDRIRPKEAKTSQETGQTTWTSSCETTICRYYHLPSSPPTELLLV